MDDGKVQTYTLTSFVPYTTTVPDDGVNSGNSENPSNATPIIAGTVVAAVVAASIVGK